MRLSLVYGALWRSSRTWAWGIWASVCVGASASGEIVARFQDDMQPGGTKTGWSYMWNVGDIGNESLYATLYPTTSNWAYYDTNGGAFNPPEGVSSYLEAGVVENLSVFGINQGLPGGHPGPGTAQEGSRERSVIFRFTLQSSGVYSLEDTLIRNAGPSYDGLNLRVYVNDTLKLWTQTAAGQNSSQTFNLSLGALTAGDRIYVAVGSKANDYSDAFALQYSIIAAVPEPSEWSLGVAVFLGFGLLARNVQRRLGKLRSLRTTS